MEINFKSLVGMFPTQAGCNNSEGQGMPEQPGNDQVEGNHDLPPANAGAAGIEVICQMPVTAEGAIDTQEFSELLKVGQLGGFSKQERDFAFAAQLMRGKHISERRLRNAWRGWTTFGELTLQAFLQRKSLLPEEELSQVESSAARYLHSLEAHQSWKEWSPTVAGRTSWLLERMDPSGRVAKVFGLSRIPKPNIGNDSRSFKARFRLIRKLGQGGLGTVWLAVNASLNRYVAIKEISGSNKQVLRVLLVAGDVGREFEFAAEKQDAGAVVLEVAEAAGGRLEGLDAAVEAFRGGVRDAVPEVRQQVRQAALQHRGDLGHRLQPAARRPAVP